MTSRMGKCLFQPRKGLKVFKAPPISFSPELRIFSGFRRRSCRLAVKQRELLCSRPALLQNPPVVLQILLKGNLQAGWQDRSIPVQEHILSIFIKKNERHAAFQFVLQDPGLIFPRNFYQHGRIKIRHIHACLHLEQALLRPQAPDFQADSGQAAFPQSPEFSC